MDTYSVSITFTQPILGTVPKDREVYASYVADKAASNNLVEEELETVETIEEKGWTGFHMSDGHPLLYDYVIKGFFKDACGMLRRVSGTKSSKIRAYRKIIDGLVFITPRRIFLTLPQGAEIRALERPLRAQTAQGERVTLARSDVLPEGTTTEFTITVLGEVDEKTLREWLDYGALRGLGQWRNGGYGTFTYQMTER
jgi:hypothetical protein